MKVILNKNICFKVIIILLYNNLNAQIDYSTIYDGGVFLNYKGKANVIHKYDLDAKRRTTVFTTIVDENSLKWTISGDKIIMYCRYGTKRAYRAVIHQFSIPLVDSIELIKNEKEEIDSLTNFLGSEDKAWDKLFEMRDFRRNRKILKIIGYISELRRWRHYSNRLREVPLKYDILGTDSTTYQLFVSFNKEFSIWSFRYPLPEENLPLQDWKDLVTYTPDTVAFKYPVINKRFILPNGSDQHRFQSISDSLFFQGDFRIIRQKGELYCINTDHGGIYHIGERIEKVAQIEGIKDYPKWLFGKAYFIEDRDRETLIFFQPVKKIESIIPTPDYEIMDKITFNKKFAKLLH